MALFLYVQVHCVSEIVAFREHFEICNNKREKLHRF